jgi:hypothetical protein
VTYLQVLLRVEMRVMFALIVCAIAVSGIFCVCALVTGVTRPWDAAVLGFTCTFYALAVPAMLFYAPLRALRLRNRIESSVVPGGEL